VRLLTRDNYDLRPEEPREHSDHTLAGQTQDAAAVPACGEEPGGGCGGRRGGRGHKTERTEQRVVKLGGENSRAAEPNPMEEAKPNRRWSGGRRDTWGGGGAGTDGGGGGGQKQGDHPQKMGRPGGRPGPGQTVKN